MNFSIEFFAPKNDIGLATLRTTINGYAKELRPDFVSLTCGAGGSDIKFPYSLATIEHMRSQNLHVVAHLPHAGRSRAQTMSILHEFRSAGAEMVLALRGDVPKQAQYESHPNGFSHTAEFVGAIKNNHPELDIFVAGYPEKHPESPTREFDLENLKKKVEAGASGVLEQFCFDSRIVAEWHKICVDQYKILCPFRPGVITMLNYDRICDIAQKCQTAIPEFIHASFKNLDKNSDLYRRKVVETFCSQLRSLATAGSDKIHVYALNSPLFIEPLSKLKWG